MTIQDVRPRAELISYLQWGHQHARKDFSLKHVVQILGSFNLYNDEELEILARATDLLDRASWELRLPHGYFPPSNPILFAKSGTPELMWQAQRQSWKSGTSDRTLPRAVSRFYRSHCLQPGWWIALADGQYDHSQPMFVQHVDLPDVFANNKRINATKIRLAAPTLTEINEFITLDGVELILNKFKTHSAD